MSRIILGMVGVNYLMVAITAYLGFMSEPPQDLASKGDVFFRYHFLMGILTALFTMLVHCMVLTYFLGTSRWVKETTAAYSLDPKFLRRSQKLRARALFYMVLCIFLTLAALISGPFVHGRFWDPWVHLLVVTGTYLFMLQAYRVQYIAIEQHTILTDQIMEEVQRRNTKPQRNGDAEKK